MMQVTRAAFQALANLNEQATDPQSHTLVKSLLQEIQRSCYLLNSDGRPRSSCLRAPEAGNVLPLSRERQLRSREEV